MSQLRHLAALLFALLLLPLWLVGCTSVITNLTPQKYSRKGDDLAANPHAALVLFWEPLHRQIRIEGRVEKVPANKSDAYFASRPRGSQLGAIASPQSKPIATRALLEEAVADVATQVADGAPPRPAYWGGYRLVPDLIELWQGQPSRLHDRVRYRKTADGWVRDRLAP